MGQRGPRPSPHHRPRERDDNGDREHAAEYSELLHPDGCKTAGRRAERLKIAGPGQPRRESHLWWVGDAVPVAVLAHGLDDCSDVARERPIRRVLGWQAGFGQHALAGSDCQDRLAVAQLVLEELAHVAEGRELLGGDVSTGDNDGVEQHDGIVSA